MKYFGEGLSEQHKRLQHIIRKEQELDAAKKLFLAIHAALHSSAISEMPCNEVDALLQDLDVYKRQDYEWVLDLHRQCVEAGKTFWFKNTGSFFRHDGIIERVNPFKQTGRAKQCGIDITDGRRLF